MHPATKHIMIPTKIQSGVGCVDMNIPKSNAKIGTEQWRGQALVLIFFSVTVFVMFFRMFVS